VLLAVAVAVGVVVTPAAVGGFVGIFHLSCQPHFSTTELSHAGETH